MKCYIDLEAIYKYEPFKVSLKSPLPVLNRLVLLLSLLLLLPPLYQKQTKQKMIYEC